MNVWAGSWGFARWIARCATQRVRNRMRPGWPLRAARSDAVGLQLVGWMLAGVLTVAGLLSPGLASAAHTSVMCPAKAGTVSRGGMVTVDVTDCAISIGFAGIGPVDGPAMPAHGTANLRIAGSSWLLDYSHNNDTATSDYFEFTDASVAGDTVGVTITITASASPITVSPGTLPVATAGVPFSQTLTSSGGLAPYTYALQGGALPPGLTLTSGGLLSGTPSQRGGYTFSVRSTDATAPTAQYVDKGYTGTVQNPTLTLDTPSGTAGQNVAFSQTLSTSGGVPPYTYAIETGSLPAGITLSSAGVVSGTTAAATGNYPVTIRVTDSSTGAGVYFEVESYTLTISTVPSVSISVSPASVSEDGGGSLTYTVTRSLNLASATVVNLTTTGTATAGSDYTGNVASVTIPAGATTATVVIQPVADGSVEPDETVTLTVAVGAGYTVGAPSSATGTILNDDVPTATIAVSPAAVLEDGAPNLIYTVTLSQAASSPVSVNFTIGGTATNGVDYATIASPLVIPAGNTSGTVTVNPTADATIEADETVTLTLAAGTGYIVGAPNSATGTILNDDLPNLTINDVTVIEGNSGITNAVFTVSLSAPAGPGGVTFNIATANGTATAGSDYVAQSLTAQTIPAGSSSYTFTVQVNGDTLNEPNETFFVNITGVTNAVVVDGQGIGTITNDDPLPALSINDVAVMEGNSGTTNAVLTVTLSAASGQTVTVNYATADGTATQPADYTAASGTLTFTPGQTTHTLTVAVMGDTVPEANETFFVNLSGATNATISKSQGVGTITNDDAAVTLSPATVANPTVAAAYSQTLSASGGVAPYSFTVTAGALPAGVSLSTGGVISGTPTAGGSHAFSVTATDSSPFPGPFSGVQAYTMVVAPPTLTLPVATLAGGTRTVPYTAVLPAASGGTPPYTYAVTAGALPGGLSFNPASRTLSGTPTADGTFNLTVTATDSSTGSGPYAATQTYAVSVQKASQTLTFPAQAPASRAFSAGATFSISPLATSSNTSAGAPAISYSSLTTGVCTVSGATVSMVTVGVCSLAANQAGDANYAAAAQVTQDVALLAQTTFNGPIVPASGMPGGTGSASFTGGGAGCTLDTGATGFAPPPVVVPPGQQLPQGLFKFRLTGCDANSTITVSVTWPHAFNGYIKYGRESAGAASDTWFVPPAYSVSGHTATFQITDNGVGDSDAALGTIVDPAGPLMTVSASVPTLGAWGRAALAVALGMLGLSLMRRKMMIPAGARR